VNAKYIPLQTAQIKAPLRRRSGASSVECGPLTIDEQLAAKLMQRPRIPERDRVQERVR